MVEEIRLAQTNSCTQRSYEPHAGRNTFAVGRGMIAARDEGQFADDQRWMSSFRVEILEFSGALRIRKEGGSAYKVFEEMPYRDTVVWNMLISCCTRNGRTHAVWPLKICDGVSVEPIGGRESYWYLRLPNNGIRAKMSSYIRTSNAFSFNIWCLPMVIILMETRLCRIRIEGESFQT
ncbi:pentatricopeptide repeat-containing protein [Striga asiatica]|uniref:Pentatricopeptide repeat-containing protein n=1 Tax=Striga asiatica TaxID=4170 RepID=A0A5A7P7L6_STRAF|nr:pentatricopeptide repeat-containing protein [Striga asiatica]